MCVTMKVMYADINYVNITIIVVSFSDFGFLFALRYHFVCSSDVTVWMEEMLSIRVQLL